MKKFKAIISVLLAAVLLFSVIPMTALAAEADPAETGADGDYAATAAPKEYTANTPAQLKQYLELDDTGVPNIITVGSDLYGELGVDNDYSDNSYVRYWITVGKGKKVLKLDGHTIDMDCDYSAIYSHPGDGKLFDMNNLTLFNVPAGADLTIMGANVNDFEGKIIYHGALLDKCNSVDQRDIIEVNGGKLTINGGKYMMDDQYLGPYNIKGYGDSQISSYLQMNGTALTINSGDVTINSGRFQGRGGGDNYYDIVGSKGPTSRNGAIEVKSHKNIKLTINGGHFEGVSHANAAHMPYSAQFDNGDIVIRSATFYVDQLDSRISTIYGNVNYTTDTAGWIGVNITKLNPYTDYYYHNNDIAYSSGDSNTYTYITEKSNNDNIKATGFAIPYKALWGSDLSKIKYFVVRPSRASKQKALLNHDGIALSKDTGIPNITAVWDKSSSYPITVDPSSMYFPYERYRFDEDKTYHKYWGYLTKVENADMITDPVWTGDAEIALTGNLNKGEYSFDLKDLPNAVKNALTLGKNYYFSFIFFEAYGGMADSLKHECYIKVSVENVLSNVDATITKPVSGAQPQTTLSDSPWYTRQIWWYKADGTALEPGVAFGTGQYYAVLRFKAKTGTSFADTTNCVVNGMKQIVTSRDDTYITAKVYFDTNASVVKITEENIGFMNPDVGKKPYFTTDSSDKVNSSVKKWIDRDTGETMYHYDTFQVGHTYRALVEVTPKAGYTIDYSTVIKLNGKKADRNADGLYFRDFVLSSSIGSVHATITEPADGQPLSYTATVGDGELATAELWGWYTEDWGEIPGGVFVEGVKYRALVRYYPQEGCTFDADAEFYLNGHRLYDKEDMGDGSYRFSYVFTAGGDPTVIKTVDLLITWPVKDAHPNFNYVEKATPATKYNIYRTGSHKEIGVQFKEVGKTKNMEADDTFEAGKTYRAMVTIEREWKDPETTATYADEIFITFNGKEGFSENFDPRVVTFTACIDITIPMTAADWHVSGARLNIDEPVAGMTPDFSATSDNPTKYTAAVTMWFNMTDGYAMGADDEFEEGKVYWLFGTFTPEGLYTFDNTTAFYVNGNDAMPHGAVGEIAYIFDLTPPTVDCASLNAYVAEPQKGNLPTMNPNILYGADRKASVSVEWHNDTDNADMAETDPFDMGKTYTATFTFNAKPGIRFVGEEDMTITINDKKIINGVDGSMTCVSDSAYTATYTWTAPAPDDDDVIATIKTPTAGEKPEYYPTVAGYLYKCDDNISTGNYRNGVLWKDDTTGEQVDKDNGTFVGGHNYSVTINFTVRNSLEDFSHGAVLFLNDKKYYLQFPSGGKKAYAMISFACPEAAAGGFTTGDVDLSGAVTNRDAVLLDRYIAGWTGYDAMIKSMDAADLDRKNGVTNRDATILDRYIAGWTGYDVYIIPIG